MADGEADSPPEIPRASEYREKANAIGSHAATVKHAGVREQLYCIATDYELLAEYLESSSRFAEPKSE